MVVLSLSVGHFTDFAGAVEASHLLIEYGVRVVLGEHVSELRLLHGAAQGDTLGEGAIGGGLTHHMFAGVQRLDGEGSVLVEVVGQHDGVHVVLKELVVVGVRRHAELGAGFVELLLPAIAQGDELHAHRLRGAAGEGTAAAYTNYSDPDLAL